MDEYDTFNVPTINSNEKQGNHKINGKKTVSLICCIHEIKISVENFKYIPFSAFDSFNSPSSTHSRSACNRGFLNDLSCYLEHITLINTIVLELALFNRIRKRTNHKNAGYYRINRWLFDIILSVVSN